MELDRVHCIWDLGGGSETNSRQAAIRAKMSLFLQTMLGA